ncbi:MAG: flippase [Bacteroidota bacterium]
MKKHFNNIREKAGRHKTLIQNFSYLSALQVFNMLIPLITYPYLIRVLGKETYGLVIFAQAIIQYLVILVEFGFNISATKEVSIHRDNKKKISEIVSSVLLTKGAFFLVTLLILSALVLLIPQAKGYETLFFLSMWACLYNVIFPMWYFQGIEKMKYITYITLVSRLTFLGLIFVFIHSPDDYLFIPIINGIGALLAGIVSLYIIFRQHRVKFKLPTIRNIKHYLKESVPIFISNVSIKLYVSTNKVIVGAFLGMAEVAYYDLGEKVTSILKKPQGILSQALFPKISKEKNLNFIKKVFNYSLLVNVLLLIGVLAGARQMVLLLGGQDMLPAVWVLNILALTVPVIAMSNIFGVQLLIPFGFSRTFSKVIISSGLIYLMQAFILWGTIGFSVISVSIITLTTEIYVTATMFYYTKKYNLWKKNMTI